MVPLKFLMLKKMLNKNLKVLLLRNPEQVNKNLSYYSK